MRLRLGPAGATPSDGVTISFDTFNDPNLAPPAVGETVTVSFPPEASLVVGAGTTPEIDVVAEA